MYSFCDNDRHVRSALDDALKWHDAMKHFSTDREREAYKAGFFKAADDQRSLFKLHAGLKLED